MADALPQTTGRSRSDRKPNRIVYYGRNILRDIVPQILYRRLRDDALRRILAYDRSEVAARINYHNKLERGARLAADSSPVSRISMDHSFYYYDLKEHARYFPRDFRLHYLFGDVTTVPEAPTFVKSRPIAGNNRNSVIVNLDKLRHFHIPPDTISFEDKQPRAVWRGSDHNPKRVALVRRYHDHPLFDVGYTNVPSGDPHHAPFLSPGRQMAYRYIISIEGNDVATNLKWILASNAVCLMPAPVYETWFMEGRLEAGRHFVQVADDFADVEEKVRYYENHPDAARAIVRNANAHVAQFLNPEREKALSLMVVYKYFAMTGQMELDPDLANLVVG